MDELFAEEVPALPCGLVDPNSPEPRADFPPLEELLPIESPIWF
jgi:hypothetical protein